MVELAAPVLEVDGLTTRFATREGTVEAVSGVSFTLAQGETLGLVGESGSGKSQIFMSVMGLLASNGRAEGSVRFRGRELLGLPLAALNEIRGRRMAMIFQDPMSSLNPYLTIGRQMTEVLVLHKGASESEALRQVIAMLERVRIPEAAECVRRYPHELSGGMRQRVMIAMGMLCRPDLLIADEPTTALDVTIQAQILELMAELKRETQNATVIITHDLGVVAGLCDRVMVMYAGRIVESGSVGDIFYDPRHPYTKGLLQSMPRLDAGVAETLVTIPGQPPNLQRLPEGCSFAARCPRVFAPCREIRPELRAFAEGRAKACHLEDRP